MGTLTKLCNIARVEYSVLSPHKVQVRCEDHVVGNFEKRNIGPEGIVYFCSVDYASQTIMDLNDKIRSGSIAYAFWRSTPCFHEREQNEATRAIKKFLLPRVKKSIDEIFSVMLVQNA